MPRSHSARLALIVVAAVTFGACGSTTKAAAPPAAPRLTLDGAGRAAEAMPLLAPAGPVEYVLDGPLADLGGDAPVRRLAGHEATAADLGRITGALGMHGAPTRSPTGWEVHDGDAVLTVDGTGAVTSLAYTRTGGSAIGSSPGSVGGGSTGDVSNGSSDTVSAPPDASQPAPAPSRSLQRVPPTPPTTTPPPVDVPDPGAAEQLARSLLGRLDVLRDAQWSVTVDDASGTAVSCAPNEDCVAEPAVVRARTATFTRVLDGVPVPDIGWSVTIGERGRVESVSGTWATVDAAGTAALRSTDAVFDDLEHGRGRFVGPQPLLATSEPAPGAPEPAPDPSASPSIVVHVTGVSLGVLRWDGTEHGRAVAYLVPTYRFHTRAAGAGASSDIELLALDPAGYTFLQPPTTGGSGSEVPPSRVVPDPITP